MSPGRRRAHVTRGSLPKFKGCRGRQSAPPSVQRRAQRALPRPTPHIRGTACGGPRPPALGASAARLEAALRRFPGVFSFCCPSGSVCGASLLRPGFSGGAATKPRSAIQTSPGRLVAAHRHHHCRHHHPRTHCHHHTITAPAPLRRPARPWPQRRRQWRRRCWWRPGRRPPSGTPPPPPRPAPPLHPWAQTWR